PRCPAQPLLQRQRGLARFSMNWCRCEKKWGSPFPAGAALVAGFIDRQRKLLAKENRSIPIAPRFRKDYFPKVYHFLHRAHALKARVARKINGDPCKRACFRPR